jgi:cell wall-associated NlpC family hydrolase
MVIKKSFTTLLVTLLMSTGYQAPSFADPIPSYPGVEKLTRGVENNFVKKVQVALIKLGYPIPVSNGKYGPATTAAIAAFYEVQGDTDDGTTLGPAGWKALFEALEREEGNQPATEEGVVEDNSTQEVKPEDLLINGQDSPAAQERARKVSIVLQRAASVKGTRYRLGGNTTSSGFDCSGFVLYAMRPVGIKFDRTSRDMRRETKKISKSELETGDLVFYHNKKGTVYHVAIYAGNGKIWHARRPGLRLAKTNINAKRISYGKVEYS